MPDVTGSKSMMRNSQHTQLMGLNRGKPTRQNLIIIIDEGVENM